MASAAIKVGPKFQVTIPQKIRTAVGLKVGDVVEAAVGPKGTIVLHPKVQLLIEKVDWDSLEPKIKKRLEEAEGDVKAGRVIGPFDTADDAVRAAKKNRARARRPH